MAAARRTFLTPEDEEFAEADAILAEHRRRADAGESDLQWGDCVDRHWDEKGTLLVTREYRVDVPGGDILRLQIREMPYSAHPMAVGGTGGVVWAGAISLAEQLCSRQELLEGARTVLEIGAGCGLPGLCAAALLNGQACAAVTLTDESEPVLVNLRHNVAANAGDLRTRVVVARLAWEDVVAAPAEALLPVEAVDVILGSDVIWGDRGPLVAQLARRLVRPEGRLVLSAQVEREGLEEFEAILQDAGGLGPAFEVEKTHTAAADGEALVIFFCRRGAAVTPSAGAT